MNINTQSSSMPSLAVPGGPAVFVLRGWAVCPLPAHHPYLSAIKLIFLLSFYYLANNGLTIIKQLLNWIYNALKEDNIIKKTFLYCFVRVSTKRSCSDTFGENILFKASLVPREHHHHSIVTWHQCSISELISTCKTQAKNLFITMEK